MMAKRKTIKSLLSLLLTAMMMFSVAIPGYATEANDATLSELYFEDLILLNFDKNTTNYDVIIPYDNTTETYYVPKVVAKATDPNANVEVTYPADVTCAAITVKVTAANGTTEMTYSLTPVCVGGNLYTNGSFEMRDGDGGTWQVKNGGYKYTDVNPGKGKVSMIVTPLSKPDIQWYKKTLPVLKANKLYYASSMGRLDASETITNYNSRHHFDGIPTGNTRRYYNQDGTERTENRNYADLTHEWKTFSATIISPSDYNIKQYFTDWAQNPVVVVDDYYVGELSATKVLVSDAEKKSKKTIALNTASEIDLTAKVLNSCGTTAGFNEVTVESWNVRETGSNITVNNGKVTIPASVAAGTYHIDAVMDLTNASLTNGQEKVMGSYEIIVTDGSLSSLTVYNGSGIDFSASKFDYSLVVPARHVDGEDIYVMPQIVAVAEKTAYTAEVSYPETVAEGEKITVTVKDENENVLDVYTLTLTLKGSNLYQNGGFENGQTNWFWGSSAAIFTVTENNPGVGTKSLEIDRSNAYAYYRYTPALTLNADTTYVGSSMVRLGDGVTGQYDTSQAFTAIPNTYYRYAPDGTSKGGFTVTPEWQRTHVVVRFNNSITTGSSEANFATFYSNWGKEKKIALDDYFIGELVISDVAITADGTENIMVNLPKNDATTVQLAAQPLNQLGVKYGLDDVDTKGVVSKNWNLSGWSLVGNPQGVSINSETGLLTISTDAEVGDVTVAVTVNPTYENASQAAYTKTAKITIVGAAYYKDNVRVNSVVNGNIESRVFFKNTSEEDIDLFFAVALYKKVGTAWKIDATHVLKDTVEAGAFYNDKQTIEVPNDGNEYAIKSFYWKNMIVPLFAEESLFSAE